MDDKLSLTAKDILEKQFQKDVKGYNPDEVDDFLDIVISDYKKFRSFHTECQEYISSLEVNVNKLNERIKELEVANSQLNTRVSAIKEGSNVNSENINLYQKINAYEKALFQRGINPKDII